MYKSYFEHYFVAMEYGKSYFWVYAVYMIIIIVILGDYEKTWKGILKKAAEIVLWWIGMQLFSGLYYMVFGDNYLNQVQEGAFIVLYMLMNRTYMLSIRIVICSAVWASEALLLSISGIVGLTPESGELGLVSTAGFLTVTFALLVLFFKKFAVRGYVLAQSYCVMVAIAIGMVGGISTSNWGVDLGFNVRDLILNIVLLGSVILVYLLFYHINKEYNQNVELLAMQNKVEIDKNNYLITQQYYEEMSMLRHEIKNHDAYIHMLLGMEEYEKLNQFVEKSLKEKSRILKNVNYGNQVVNSVLNYEMNLANEKGIKMDIKVSVAEKIMVSETELYSLLSNVLDNAREACMDLEEKEKEIVVRITQNKGYLFIHTENSFQKDGEKEDILELQTTKANKRAHGYGTKIIRMIVERYQGYVHYDVKGDRFITDVMIAIAKEA